MSCVNINVETGIHFGVIPVSALNPEIIYEELQPVYNCQECEVSEEDRESIDSPCDCCEDFHTVIDTETLKVRLDDHGDLWVFLSPVKTKCRKCSPCAPNAGYILDQDEDGIETYAFPSEYYNENYKRYAGNSHLEIALEKA